MKLLYFTATGNSLYVAKALGGELFSIPKMTKEGNFTFTDEKIGIVFPLHAWSVPTYVVDFLKKATFNCKYLFAIVTYGVYTGAVANHLVEISKEAGFDFAYINRIRMIDNYLPGFDMQKEIKKEPKKEIEKHLEIIKSDIENSKKSILKESSLDKFATNYMIKRGNKPFNKKTLKVHAIGEGIENYIIVNDSCTQCGICTRVCPVDNIKIDTKKGKISLSNRCFMCFACVQNCPSNAIHIKGEVSKSRYRNKNITLQEIVMANK